MSIIIDEKTRVVVQGITGGEGTFHTQRMQEYGTTVVAGVTPGKGGTTHLNVPVYNSVADAVEKEGADASAIFVPAFLPLMLSWKPQVQGLNASSALPKEFRPLI